MMMIKKRKRQIRNINSKLPSSIMAVIFSKLPFYNLPRCRMVCKEWNDLILASKFDPQISMSTLFFNRLSRKEMFCIDCDPNPWKGMRSVASFKFPPKLCSLGNISSLNNSCNGLLCLTRRKKSSRKVCVFNPMTNECFRVSISKPDRNVSYRYGLGFSLKTKQYKMARCLMCHDFSGTSIQIYSFGTNGQWMTIDCFPLSYVSHFIYFDGGLYFFNYNWSPTNDKCNVIYRLDVEGEKLYEISPPEYRNTYSMVHFNDALYLISCGCVWKMKEDFSWIKVFVPDIGRSLNIIKIFEDEKILGSDGVSFIMYDPKTETKLILGTKNVEHHKIKVTKSCHVPQFWRASRICSINFESLHNILLQTG